MSRAFFQHWISNSENIFVCDDSVLSCIASATTDTAVAHLEAAEGGVGAVGFECERDAEGNENLFFRWNVTWSL